MNKQPRVPAQLSWSRSERQREKRPDEAHIIPNSHIDVINYTKQQRTTTMNFVCKPAEPTNPLVYNKRKKTNKAPQQWQ